MIVPALAVNDVCGLKPSSWYSGWVAEIVIWWTATDSRVNLGRALRAVAQMLEEMAVPDAAALPNDYCVPM